MSFRHLLLLAGLFVVSDAAAQTPDPFVRYATPGQCEQAAERLYNEYWRDKRPDTVVYGPLTDSVPTPVLQAARACASRFNVQSVPERELLNLAQLYLWSNQDELAQAALDRLLASSGQKATEQRAWTLNLIAGSYLSARPTQLETANRYLQQLDALGKSAALYQMFAHSRAARFAMGLNDIPTAESEGNAAVKANSEMEQNDRIDWATSLIGAYASLADPTSISADGKAALAVMDRAESDILPLRPEESQERAYLASYLRSIRSPYTLFGVKGTPLRADHWYNNSGDSTKYPTAGKVSLIVFVQAACGGRCYSTYETLRRIHDKFSSRGLEIVLIASTNGYFRNQLVQQGPESDSTSGYFLNFLKLPGVLAVSETDYTHKPDGRRVNTPTPNIMNYSRGRSGVLINKQGSVALVVNALPNREKLLESAIEAALR